MYAFKELELYVLRVYSTRKCALNSVGQTFRIPERVASPKYLQIYGPAEITSAGLFWPMSTNQRAIPYCVATLTAKDCDLLMSENKSSGRSLHSKRRQSTRVNIPPQRQSLTGEIEVHKFVRDFDFPHAIPLAPYAEAAWMLFDTSRNLKQDFLQPICIRHLFDDNG